MIPPTPSGSNRRIESSRLLWSLEPRCCGEWFCVATETQNGASGLGRARLGVCSCLGKWGVVYWRGPDRSRVQLYRPSAFFMRIWGSDSPACTLNHEKGRNRYPRGWNRTHERWHNKNDSPRLSIRRLSICWEDRLGSTTL